jgi:type I restriction enzyme S subunit
MTLLEPMQWALSRVPDSWTQLPLKAVAQVNPESLTEATEPTYEFDYIDIGSVDSLAGIVDPSSTTFGEAPSRARRIIRSGDVLVSTVRTYLRAIARCPRHPRPLVASTGFAVLRPVGVDPSYLYWWLRSTGFVEQVVAQSVGVSYPAINASEIADLTVAFPSLDEQRTIAASLDASSTRIQELAAELRTLRSHAE